MAITIERNGKEFSFPDNYTQEQIDNSLIIWKILYL